MPNTTYTYVWEVRERSGPGPRDPSSVVWMYHSHRAEVQDTISGLYGAMIVSRKARRQRTRRFGSFEQGCWSQGSVVEPVHSPIQVFVRFAVLLHSPCTCLL